MIRKNDDGWTITLLFNGIIRLVGLLFRGYALRCFDILDWNFAYGFILLYYLSSFNVVTLRQLLKELCLFLNLEYRNYAVFHTFLLHALTYWAEMLHMTLFYCTTHHVWVPSIFVNLCRTYAPFWDLDYWKFPNVELSIQFQTRWRVILLVGKIKT